MSEIWTSAPRQVAGMDADRGGQFNANDVGGDIVNRQLLDLQRHSASIYPAAAERVAAMQANHQGVVTGAIMPELNLRSTTPTTQAQQPVLVADNTIKEHSGPVRGTAGLAGRGSTFNGPGVA